MPTQAGSRHRSWLGSGWSPGALLVVLAGLAGAPAHGGTAPSLDEVFRARSQKADYVVAIDRSGSMAAFWDVVMNGTADFVQALPDGDHVSVVLFDRESSGTAVLPRTIDERSRANLSRELRVLPRPTGKGTQARTDLGAALSGVVDELRRPDANPLQFVFLFSDFVHEPGRDSGFGRDATTETWRNLARTADLATSDRAVSAFALQLPLGRDVGRDIGLVRAVLPDLTVAPVVDRAALAEWFSRKRSEIQREKLRVLVTKDAARGWSVESGGTDRLTFRSRLQFLSLRITVERLAADGLDIESDRPGAFTLPPSGSLDVGVRAVEMVHPEGWRRLFATRSAATEAVHLKVTGFADLEPKAEISSRLQLEATSRFERTARVPATVGREGTPLAVQLALTAGLVFAGLFAWRTWGRRPAPVAAYVRRISIVERGGPHREELAVPRSGDREIVVGNEGGSHARSSLAVDPFTLRLVSRRPSLFRLAPKRGLYAYTGAGLLSYVARRRGKPEDRPLPMTLVGAVPIGYASKVVLMAAGRTFEITFRR